MDLGLTGKNAIIGASSQGLGFACAMELAKEGANVLICGRRQDILADAEKAIKAAGPGSVTSVVADLSVPEGQRAILDAAQNNMGTVNILITNTGGPPPGKFEDHAPEAWDAAYRLLLASTVAMINGVLPGMKKEKWGRIIAITSQAVKQPVDGLILSNSVRASVVGLCRTLANELGPHKITVNTNIPGYTRTERMKQLLKKAPDFVDLKKMSPWAVLASPKNSPPWQRFSRANGQVTSLAFRCPLMAAGSQGCCRRSL